MPQNRETPTTLTDIDIPFGRMVVIMLKIMLASIPAVILFYLILGAGMLFVAAFFGGGAALLNNIHFH